MSENYHAAKQAEKWSPFRLTCPWCQASNINEDVCEECHEPMDGHSYIACPYCGNEVSEEYAHSNSCCGERHWERKEPGCEPTTI